MQLSTKTQIPIKSCQAVDSEMCRFRKGLPAPPVVCTSFSAINCPPALYNTQDQWKALCELFDSNWLIVGHNLAFDCCCWMEWGPPELRELIFDAYDNDRVLDTLLAQRLVEIETGDHRGFLALDSVCARYGLECPKDEKDENGQEIRTGYGKFLGLPLSAYPECYKHYAKNDADVTIQLFSRILTRGLVKRDDLAKMSRIALGLKLTSAFGMRCDPERVADLELQAKTRIDMLQGVMLEHKFMRWERGKLTPTRTMKNIHAAVAAAYDLTDRIKDGKYVGSDIRELQTQGIVTDTGRMSSKKTVLEDSGDKLLESLADYGEWSAVLNKDLKIFRDATELPFHSRFGFAATTRSTSSDPNIQNFRKADGVRRCIRPQLGAFVFSDYAGLENGTLAQTIVWALGRRGMADKISAGWDFHCDMGAHAMGITYEDMLARYKANDPEATKVRASCKPLNFGLVGFMTKATTVASYARVGYSVDLPVPKWQSLIDLWYATQHDQVAYLHEYVDSLRVSLESRSLYSVPIPSTGIIRRGATRTAAANTPFQGLGAQVAGYGLYLVARAQMLGDMPGRACAFIHDENGTDCAPEDVPQVGYMQDKLMIQAAEALLPDVRMKVDTLASSHWSKSAKATHDKIGQLAVTAV